MSKPESNCKIRPAQAPDQKRIHSLLSDFGLPLDGLDETRLWVLQSSSGEVTGVAGLESYGNQGLLRSVAVVKTLHDRGYGKLLAKYVIGEAKKMGVQEIFLLTTSAAAFFEKFGFKKENRENVIGGVAGSIEFRSACPKTAALMHLSLGAH